MKSKKLVASKSAAPKKNAGVRAVKKGSAKGSGSASKKAVPVSGSADKGKRKAHTSAVQIWNLRLYVAGQTPRSLTAFSNLKRLCEEFLPGRYQIEVVDLVSHPHLAQGDQIVALPTLVRKLPEPIKRVIGDLSNFEKVMIGIDLRVPLEL